MRTCVNDSVQAARPPNAVDADTARRRGRRTTGNAATTSGKRRDQVASACCNGVRVDIHSVSVAVREFREDPGRQTNDLWNAPRHA